MGYLCIIGLFLLTAFVWLSWLLGHLWLSWLLGHLGDTMVDDRDDIEDED